MSPACPAQFQQRGVCVCVDDSLGLVGCSLPSRLLPSALGHCDLLSFLGHLPTPTLDSSKGSGPIHGHPSTLTPTPVLQCQGL